MINRIALTVCAATVILMGVFPPWNYIFKIEGRYAERPAGYVFIGNPPTIANVNAVAKLFGHQPPAATRDAEGEWHQPTLRSDVYSVQIDTKRLAIQMGVTILFCGLIAVAFHPKRL